MKAKEAIRNMMADANKSGLSVSREIGRTDNFIYSLLNKKTDPLISTLTRIANVCGYDIVAEKRGGDTKYMIDPPNE